MRRHPRIFGSLHVGPTQQAAGTRHRVTEPKRPVTCGYRQQMGYGVIGNTADSGSAILGSSPGTPATSARARSIQPACSGLGRHSRVRYAGTPVLAPSSSGLGRRPLTAVAWVRIPSGLQTRCEPAFGPQLALGGRGDAAEAEEAGQQRVFCVLGPVIQSRRVSASAAANRSAAQRAPGRRPIRSIGPDTETAAITAPRGRARAPRHWPLRVHARPRFVPTRACEPRPGLDR